MSQDLPVSGSITRLIPRVKEGDDSAYNELVARILTRVIKIAEQIYSRKYPGVPRRAADAEDAVQDALFSLWKGVQRGMFEQLADRNDLWNLLATITARKLAKRYRAEITKKRGGKGHTLSMDQGLANQVDEIPAPDLAAMMKDTYNTMMASLPKEHALVVRDWAEGRSRHETAEELHVTITTVSRMRRDAMETLGRAFPTES
ncbi:MAG: RNA polymerase sigma factor [Thermomicrobiales bacterium]